MIKLNKETRSTSSKQFTLKATNPNNGLCFGELTEITVSHTEPIDAQSSMRTFIGQSLPRLTFTFKEHAVNPTDEAGLYIHAFLPTDPTQQNAKVFEEAMGGHLAHYLDVFGIDRSKIDLGLYTSDGKEIIETRITKEDDAKVLLADVSAEELLLAWTKFFEAVKGLFFIKETSLFAGIKLWIKLLLYNNGKEVNRGNPGFPMFVGTGVIEKHVQGKTPSISINKARGESIEAKEKVVAAPTNMPPVGGGVIEKPAWL